MPPSFLRSTPRRLGISACLAFVSWPRSRTGDWQSIADIGQVVFEIAIFVGLRLKRHAANVAVAGGKASADGAHAAPFGAVDRHRIENSERGRQYLGANPLARILYTAAGPGEVERSSRRIEIALAVLKCLQRARIVRDLDIERLAAGGE